MTHAALHGGAAAAIYQLPSEYKCKNDRESTGIHRRASGTLAPAHGAGAAAAGAATGRRARKLPPPATLLLLGENGKRPCRCRHFFIAATCLSHALYGSRPLEFTTRCEQTGGRESNGMSATAAQCSTHDSAFRWCSQRQQEALQCRQARAGRGGRPSTATSGNSPHLEALLVLGRCLGAHYLRMAMHHLQKKSDVKTCWSASCVLEPAANPTNALRHCCLPPPAAAAAAAAGDPTLRERPAGPTWVSRLLQIDWLVALLRKQCSSVPSARPQRLQGVGCNHDFDCRFCSRFAVQPQRESGLTCGTAPAAPV